MVSKVAVIALVAIVACPILLGYGMNLSETTVTEYKSNNDPMNVTQLLQTGTDWSIANGDPYQLNSNANASFAIGNLLGTYPIYNTISSVKTTTPMMQGTIANWSATNETNISSYQDYQVWFNYIVSSSPVRYVNAKVYYNNGNSYYDFPEVIYLRYSAETEKITAISSSDYNSPTVSGGTYNVPNITKIEYQKSGYITLYYNIVKKSGNTDYADISDGFYFKKMSNKPLGSNGGWDLNLPDNTISVLLSINLDSITDSSYNLLVEQIGSYPVSLIKTTTDGVVSWQLHKAGTTYDLYYNPNITDNTYQILFTDTGMQGLSNTGHMQLRYIGHWQKTIGEANYYQTYEMDYTQMGIQGNTLDSISLVADDDTLSRTPTIRIDAAKFRAYEYQVIEGTLNPAAFKTNPATSITNIEQYGDQIIFGGNTYNVSNGNITLGTHQIPIKNMILDSIPNADTLQYDNRINGTVVSTTAAPSTIQFVGKWAANLNITSMQQTSYTKTEWTPGHFGWDGVDQNFLMVGLLTSIGVFIALGIYIRRTKANLWPLLLVCGGAAVLFFTML